MGFEGGQLVLGPLHQTAEVDLCRDRVERPLERLPYACSRG